MANETIITIIGNLTDDPELRFTPSGAAVCNLKLASTPRHFDKATNEWKDGDTLFMRASAWRDLAENIAESLQKGNRVIAQGYLQMRPYETRDGEKRTSTELQITAIGPDLTWATAKVTRTSSSGRTARSSDQQQRPPAGGSSRPADDPWARPAGQHDEPPF